MPRGNSSSNISGIAPSQFSVTPSAMNRWKSAISVIGRETPTSTPQTSVLQYIVGWMNLTFVLIEIIGVSLLWGQLERGTNYACYRAPGQPPPFKDEYKDKNGMLRYKYWCSGLTFFDGNSEAILTSFYYLTFGTQYIHILGIVAGAYGAFFFHSFNLLIYIFIHILCFLIALIIVSLELFVCKDGWYEYFNLNLVKCFIIIAVIISESFVLLFGISLFTKSYTYRKRQ